MTLLIKHGIFCWQKTIDLAEIDAAGFKQLNTLRVDRRATFVAYILKKFSDKEILELVEKLSVICFDINGPGFIRNGSTNFLADIIRAYVDKHDGKGFAKAYHEEQTSLRSFKFSSQSTAIFTLLSNMASAKSKEKACPDFTEWLPQNISNKIWFPILLRRTPSHSFLKLSQKMQSLAQDGELLTSIFNSNINEASGAELGVVLEI